MGKSTGTAGKETSTASDARRLLADEGIEMHNVAKGFMRRTVHLCKEREQLKARIAELEAENAQMRPVFEAAESCRDILSGALILADEISQEIRRRQEHLQPVLPKGEA